MRYYKIENETNLIVNNSLEGETIETKIERILTQREPIKDGAPLIYTERNGGVLPEHDIRTDRWEVAIDAMDKVTRSQIAKSEAKKEAAKEAAPVIEQAVVKGEKAVTDTFNTAQDQIKAANATRMANNAQKEAQKINTLAGTIVQGTPEDIAKAKAALTTIETKGIKTYKDLVTALDEKVASVSSGLDSVLSTNTTIKPLKDLAVTTKVGESEVAHNYVEDAISQLKTMYEKTNDVVGAEKMAQLEAKATAEGLTVKEINDLAKLHGREINAFNANGEAASGLSKQAAENTRTGLKTTAREIFGNKVYSEADAQLADLIRTRDLVTNVAKKVNQLQQRVTERGWGEKIGRAVFQLTDKITGGGLKGDFPNHRPTRRSAEHHRG